MIAGLALDLWYTIVNVFGSVTSLKGVIAIALVLLFGMQMKKLNNLVSYTLGALGLYVVLSGLSTVGEGIPFGTAMQQMWGQSDLVTLRGFLMYFASFSLLMGTVFLLKSGLEKGIR